MSGSDFALPQHDEEPFENAQCESSPSVKAFAANNFPPLSKTFRGTLVPAGCATSARPPPAG